MLAKRFIEMTTVEVQLEINDRSHIVHIKENGEDIDAVALVFCQENGLPSDEETVAQISDSLKGALEEHLQQEIAKKNAIAHLCALSLSDIDLYTPLHACIRVSTMVHKAVIPRFRTGYISIHVSMLPASAVLVCIASGSTV
jgi:hypothetical protein